MIERFTFGKTVPTGAVVQELEAAPSGAVMQFGTLCSASPFKWTYRMDRGGMVFGLGEQMKGINKRGGIGELGVHVEELALEVLGGAAKL